MKQLGLALHSFHDAQSQLPSGFMSTPVNPNFNSTNWCNTGGSFQRAPWLVSILPYIEQDALFRQFNMNEPFGNAGFNTEAPNNIAVPISMFQCPSDETFRQFPTRNSYFGVMGGGVGWVSGNPGGGACSNTGCTDVGTRVFYVNGVMYPGSRTQLVDIKDGTSNVFMLGESRYSDRVWTVPGKLDSCAGPVNLAATQDQINLQPITSRGINVMSRGFSSFHPGGCNMLMADASVQFINENIDLNTYRNLGIRSNGLPLGGFEK